MIIRRMADAIRTQNWFTVIIEILIVVIGIFLGLQVTEWNNERGDRNEERRYYGQLLLDLAQDVETAEFAIRLADRNDQAGDLVHAALTTDNFTVEDPTELVVSIEVAGYAFIPQSVQQTYEELKSTGNLRLLRNFDLKREISKYYGDLARVRQWDSGLRQIQFQYDSSAVGLLNRDQLRAIQNRSITVSENEARIILENARMREGLVNKLAGLAELQARLRRDSVDMRDRATALITLVKAEIGQ